MRILQVFLWLKTDKNEAQNVQKINCRPTIICEVLVGTGQKLTEMNGCIARAPKTSVY